MSKIDIRTVNRFKKGDKDAFEEIFYTYKNTIFYIAYLYVKDYDEANDCVQEVFIRLLSKIHLYDEKKAPFDTWLYSLAKTCILNHMRKNEIYYKMISVDNDTVDKCIDNNFSSIQDILIDLENIMGRDMYIIYILRTCYDLSFIKIGDIININRETVRRMYNDSIKIVNEYMKEEQNEKEHKA